MAEKRDQFTYEDLKREPGNLIEARDWNTAMWAIEEVGTRLTALGDAVPRKNGANTLTGPLTIEDALTVGNHVVIRSAGTTSPAATLEVAGEVKVGTDATINGALSVSKNASINGNATITQNATITGNATVSGTLTVTEQVRIQKNAIPEGTNDCQLEIYSPNTRQVQDYVKIRFHQANQYYAWLGYHGLAANTAGEFVFFDLNKKKEADVRAGALTCTADAQVQGKLEVAGALQVRSHLTVEGGADITDIVTAKDVHLDGASVAEMLRNWRAREETPIAWKIVAHRFQPNTIAIEVAPNGQTVRLHGLTVPPTPDMPLTKGQILSLRGVVEIPIQLIAPTDDDLVLYHDRVICEVVSLSLEPVYAWPPPQEAAQNWSVRAIDIAAPPWVRGERESVRELIRREVARRKARTDFETQISMQKLAADINYQQQMDQKKLEILSQKATIQQRASSARESIETKYRHSKVESIQKAFFHVFPRLFEMGPIQLRMEERNYFSIPYQGWENTDWFALWLEGIHRQLSMLSQTGHVSLRLYAARNRLPFQSNQEYPMWNVEEYWQEFNRHMSAPTQEYQADIAREVTPLEEQIPPLDQAERGTGSQLQEERDREYQRLDTLGTEWAATVERAREIEKRGWPSIAERMIANGALPDPSSPVDHVVAAEIKEEMVRQEAKQDLETQITRLITPLIDQKKQEQDTPWVTAWTEYQALLTTYNQKKEDILKETVDYVLQADTSGMNWPRPLPRDAYAGIYQQLLAAYQNSVRELLIPLQVVNYGIPVPTEFIVTACEKEKLRRAEIDAEYAPQLALAKARLAEAEQSPTSTLGIASAMYQTFQAECEKGAAEYASQLALAKARLEQEEKRYIEAVKKREIQVPPDLDSQLQPLLEQLDHIEREMIGAPRTVPVPTLVRGFSEPAPWTLRLLITYATRMETSRGLPPPAALRGLPTRVPMRLTA